MHRFSVPSALVVLLVCGVVASAGVIGTYAIVAPLVTGETPETSDVRIFVDDYLPVRLRRNAGGSLVPANYGTVTFVQNGGTVREANVGGGGTVQVNGLEYGPYSIFVRGQDGFAAFGTWIAPAERGLGNPGSLIDVGLVPGQDMPLVRKIIDDHLGHLRDSRSPLLSQQEPQSSDDAETSDVAAEAFAKRDLIQGEGFAIRPDGSVHGRIVRSTPPTEPEPPIPGLDVYFIQSGRIVGEAQTDIDGLFHIDGMTAGVHSLVVAGSDAFLALATEVHPPIPGAPELPSITDIPFDDPEATQSVAIAQEVTVAQVSPVYPSDLGYLTQNPPGQDDVPLADASLPPLGPGAGGGGVPGGGGGVAGGGGGIGGGGGLGALLGLGALGAAAAALADNDSNAVPQVSPAGL